MKTINTIVKFAPVLFLVAVALGFCCPCGASAQSTEPAVSSAEQLLIEAKATLENVRAELAESKARLAELETREAEISAEIEASKPKVKVKKCKNCRTLQLTPGEKR